MTSTTDDDEHPQIVMAGWVVYQLGTDNDHDHYRARRFHVYRDGRTLPTAELVAADTLEEMRTAFRQHGLMRVDRRPDDPHEILEVWL